MTNDRVAGPATKFRASAHDQTRPVMRFRTRVMVKTRNLMTNDRVGRPATASRASAHDRTLPVMRFRRRGENAKYYDQ